MIYIKIIILFDAQKGINALDRLSNKVHLEKGIEEKPGIGVYPVNLTKDEFHKIIIKMVKDGKIEEVKKIMNQRSMVLREGENLKSIDYIDYFKEDFNKIANELEEAAKVSTNKDFNEYLILQAKALRKADPMLDAYADKKWAELQDTPLELTLTRENYQDNLTGTFIENEELKNLLKEHDIHPEPKDCLGLRVGIINKQGTEALTAIKKYLPILAKNMPFNNEYEQNVIGKETIKQTMVDVDMIIATGHVGQYRGGVVTAENLPNVDKLALSIGGGRRNVYHRQVRFVSDKDELQNKLNTILDSEQHKYYNSEASHWATIGHENAHSLGPKENRDKLGKYKNIIEENKADMAAFAFLDVLCKLGMYTEEQVKHIIVTEVVANFLKAKPDINQAHRVRTVMQNKYIFDKKMQNKCIFS